MTGLTRRYAIIIHKEMHTFILINITTNSMSVYLNIITYHFHRTILEWPEKMHKAVGGKKNNLKIYIPQNIVQMILL